MVSILVQFFNLERNMNMETDKFKCDVREAEITGGIGTTSRETKWYG